MRWLEEDCSVSALSWAPHSLGFGYKVRQRVVGKPKRTPKCHRRSNINVLCTSTLTHNVVHCFSWQLLKMLTQDRATEQQNCAAFSLDFSCTVLNCESFLCLSLLITLTAANGNTHHFCPTFMLMLVCPARLSRHQLQPHLPKGTDKPAITWPSPAEALAVRTWTDCVLHFPQAGLHIHLSFSPQPTPITHSRNGESPWSHWQRLRRKTTYT